MFSKFVRPVARAAAARAYHSAASPVSSTVMARLAAGGVALGLSAVLLSSSGSGSLALDAAAAVDYNAVRKAIADLLDDDSYDDGSLAPVFIRLAWHGSGSYDKASGTGGSNGATIRFSPEKDYGANAGLGIAMSRLEAVKKQFPGITYADLYTLAGVVAVEEMGGPTIPWRAGRVDSTAKDGCPPDGRLPDASKGSSHIRDVFYAKGFNDQEITALVGCHAVGRMHLDRSGYDKPWTRAPTTFSNDFFKLLLNEDWTPRRNAKGNVEYYNKTGELGMLPADMEFKLDPSFRKWSEIYANDQDRFFKDFAAAYVKLLELGVAFPPASEEKGLLGWGRCCC